jgi:hypothetical protein
MSKITNAAKINKFVNSFIKPDNEQVVNQVSDNSDTDSTSNEASESEYESTNEEITKDKNESESENENERKTKEKKQKHSFDELTTKLEEFQGKIKNIDKEIKELSKQVDTKEKVKRDYERQILGICKILLKTHNDEINKAIKSKPKRKGNVNGGFNKEQPVPKILCDFIGLSEDTCMARPKVMSALNNKFSELKLKKGQITTIDKSTAKALGLGRENYGREIKFTEFQSFLASFYVKKEEKEVEV